MTSRLLTAWCVAAVLVAAAEAYSSGAPESTCVDMTPKHPVAPQRTPAPYTLTTSSKVVKAGQPLEVVIEGKSPKDTIKGFLLQARAGDKPVGEFKIASSDPYAQLLNCGTPGNAVTHKKHDEKEDRRTLVFTWVPPVGFSDEIKFRATVALNGGVFWVGIESAPVKVTA